MQLLHLDSSVLGAASVSRQLSAEIVARQRVLHPGLQVVYRDLAADPALHLTGTHMAAWQGAQVEDEVITADLVKGNAYLSELLAADIVVIGAPMYNLSIPTPLKSWIDRIAIAGKTFHYTSIGPEGLLVGKKAFVASSRGGIYAQGSPRAAIEHQESYLLALLAFLGMTDTTVVRAEGLAMGADVKDAAVGQALQDIAAFAA
ncbi:FMN-dependent NADH-azoreductase [Simplicispira hankyongi]|uniref:FMN dependent NADH:quinone oxidoreductase n=1 Tax=Simplicispira hankyongi TaxID=2315688 RepID=A0A398CGN3_9BURK|nr:NAD(P)H-dependent oxidoreductase [Simplicispira hankyongi]RID98866.1 FMN-dependent NADH-azoreductase [Simplicispira hankyongi]